jgi:signal transduction protein with GAF and PtsI domain
LERQAFADKKAIIFDMMIDIAEEEYKIDIRKTLRTIDHFKTEEQQTIMFACNLFGIDRVYYRRIKRKINKEAKAIEVVSMIHQVRQSMPGW